MKVLVHYEDLQKLAFLIPRVKTLDGFVSSLNSELSKHGYNKMLKHWLYKHNNDIIFIEDLTEYDKFVEKKDVSASVILINKNNDITIVDGIHEYFVKTYLKDKLELVSDYGTRKYYRTVDRLLVKLLSPEILSNTIFNYMCNNGILTKKCSRYECINFFEKDIGVNITYTNIREKKKDDTVLQIRVEKIYGSFDLSKGNMVFRLNYSSKLQCRVLTIQLREE